MRLKSSVYQAFLSLFRKMPFQPTFAHILRALPLNLDRYYKDLRFKGVFKVKAEDLSFRTHHLGSTIENELFWKGLDHSFEEDTIWLWKDFCRKSEVILDIGANTGLYSLIARSLSKESRVIAFEPSDKMFKHLARNVRLNDFDITCEKKALSNTNEDQVFFDVLEREFSSSGSLSSAMLKDKASNSDDMYEYTVRCVTLDSYLIEKAVNRVDLVKIDVELHEPEVFEGFRSIQQYRPAIVVEVLTEVVANRIAAVTDLSDYHIYRLLAPSRVEKLSTIRSAPEHRNILLLPVERALPANTITL